MKLPACAALTGAMAIGLAARPARAQEPPPPPPSTAPVDGEPAPSTTEVPEGALPPPTGQTKAKPGKLRTGSGDTDEDEGGAPSADEVSWGFGARMRYITVPTALINIFVEHSTPMRSFSVAGEVVRRKQNFDIVISLEYANVSPKDGLWQEKGENPGELGMYPDLLKFDGLALLSGDISFIWHLPITDWMAFRYGAGIGIGVPLGGFTQQDTTCSSTTTNDDLDDPNACTPVPGKIDQADLPPIVPIANVLLGFRFKLVDQLSLQIEGGWRFPALFVGGGVGYFF